MNTERQQIRAILRRWDALATRQLAERASALDEQNEQLRHDLRRAEDSAEFWHANATELALAEYGQAGLTIEGKLVRMPEV